MLESFWTIENDLQEEIYVKKSQFIASAFQVSSEEKFKDRLQFVKKKYKDARHNVFAYRLSNGLERYSDDGEPSGTAGKPILDILRGTNLYDVGVIVTRYFGGILLGTGGLVKAYSDVTKLVLDKISIKQKKLAIEYQLIVSYNDYNVVQHYCSINDFVITNSIFSNEVVLQIVVKNDDETKFTKEMKEILGGKTCMQKLKKDFYI